MIIMRCAFHCVRCKDAGGTAQVHSHADLPGIRDAHLLLHSLKLDRQQEAAHASLDSLARQLRRQPLHRRLVDRNVLPMQLCHLRTGADVQTIQAER